MVLLILWAVILVMVFFTSRIHAGDYDFGPGILTVGLLLAGIIFTLAWILRGVTK